MVPGATETVSYQMPAVRSGGRIVVWYAASRITIRLPADEPVPVSLVERIVEARLRENASA